MKAMIIAVISINFMYFSCCRRDVDAPVLKGKLVYTSCAAAVVQIMDTSQFYHGQPAWQHSPSSPVYNNVFAVENLCSYRSGRTLNVGDEFFFQVTNAGDTDCNICAMVDNPPAVKLKINVKK